MKALIARATVFLLLSTMILPACKRAEKDPYQLVAVKGPSTLLRLQSSIASTLYIADSGKYRHVPMRDGELFYASGDDDGALFRYMRGSHDTIDVTFKDSLAYVNGQLHQVSLRSASDMLPFLQRMTRDDRRDIRALHITGDLRADYLPWIDSIAVVNPSVDLQIEADSIFISAKQLQWLAARFRPTAMVVEMLPEELPLLEVFSSLQQLYLILDRNDSTRVEPVLPPLPALRSLSLDLQENDSLFAPSVFFQHHRNLGELALKSTTSPYEALSGALPDLQRLYVITDDSLQRLPYGTWFSQLEGLFIHQPLATDFDMGAFQSGHRLQELGLSSSIRQDQFNALIAHQKHLRLLELYGTDTLVVRDYASLKQLSRLEYLTIGEQIGDISSLQSLKQLRFLSVPAADSTDSVKFSQLERALPNTRVTPNGGFCMGTGWILLGIPVMIMSLLFWKKVYPQKHHP